MFSYFCHVAGVQTRDQAGAPPQGCGAVCGGAPGGVWCVKDQPGEENPALHPELVHPPRDRGGHRQTLIECTGTNYIIRYLLPYDSLASNINWQAQVRSPKVLKKVTAESSWSDPFLGITDFHALLIIE